MITNVIIKRKKYHSYREEDIICNSSGKEITRQRNLNVRNRYGAKKYKYNGQILTVKQWELLYNGTIYEDTRYQAKKRLYWYLWRKQNYLESI